MATSLQEFIQQLLPLYPELVVITIALTVLLLDFFVDRKYKAMLGWYSLLGIVIAASMTIKLAGLSGSFFGGTFLLDPFSVYFKLAFYTACGLGILISMKYLDIENIHRGEYYALMLFATCGMMLMASA